MNQLAPTASFHRFRDAAAVGAMVEPMLPLVHEAGNPYFDWFFGGGDATRRILRDWMRRPSSEVYVGRVVAAMEKASLIGGFIALAGEELERCRSADAIAAMRSVGRENVAALRERMHAGQEIFSPVARDDFYLSKIGVVPERRRQRYGESLLERFLDDGREQGHSRFRLDVSATNESAIRFYERAGFRKVAESGDPESRPSYVAMVLDG